MKPVEGLGIKIAVQSKMKRAWPDAMRAVKNSNMKKGFLSRRCFLKFSHILMLMPSAKVRQIMLPMISTVMKKLTMLASGSVDDVQQNGSYGLPFRLESA